MRWGDGGDSGSCCRSGRPRSFIPLRVAFPRLGSAHVPRLFVRRRRARCPGPAVSRPGLRGERCVGGSEKHSHPTSRAARRPARALGCRAGTIVLGPATPRRRTSRAPGHHEPGLAAEHSRRPTAAPRGPFFHHDLAPFPHPLFPTASAGLQERGRASLHGSAYPTGPSSGGSRSSPGPLPPPVAGPPLDSPVAGAAH